MGNLLSQISAGQLTDKEVNCLLEEAETKKIEARLTGLKDFNKDKGDGGEGSSGGGVVDDDDDDYRGRCTTRPKTKGRPITRQSPPPPPPQRKFVHLPNDRDPNIYLQTPDSEIKPWRPKVPEKPDFNLSSWKPKVPKKPDFLKRLDLKISVKKGLCAPDSPKAEDITPFFPDDTPPKD